MRNKAIVKSLLLKLLSFDLPRSSNNHILTQRESRETYEHLAELVTANQEHHVVVHQADSSISRFPTHSLVIKLQISVTRVGVSRRCVVRILNVYVESEGIIPLWYVWHYKHLLYHQLYVYNRQPVITLMFSIIHTFVSLISSPEVNHINHGIWETQASLFLLTQMISVQSHSNAEIMTDFFPTILLISIQTWLYSSCNLTQLEFILFTSGTD